MRGGTLNSPGSDVSVDTRGAVLLVDEDDDDRHYYSTILKAFGYDVRSFGSFNLGACALDVDAFDLIIVSQGSSRFEGRCVLERANQIDRRLPVLVVARHLDMPCYLEAMRLGAADYLSEPITVQELGQAVATHLRARLSSQERAVRANPRLRSAGVSGCQ
jgi:DNA-binding NtrC family response regulator